MTLLWKINERKYDDLVDKAVMAAFIAKYGEPSLSDINRYITEDITDLEDKDNARYYYRFDMRDGSIIHAMVILDTLVTFFGGTTDTPYEPDKQIKKELQELKEDADNE
jgi:hypothetical protein